MSTPSSARLPVSVAVGKEPKLFGRSASSLNEEDNPLAVRVREDPWTDPAIDAKGWVGLTLDPRSLVIVTIQPGIPDRAQVRGRYWNRDRMSNPAAVLTTHLDMMVIEPFTPFHGRRFRKSKLVRIRWAEGPPDSISRGIPDPQRRCKGCRKANQCSILGAGSGLRKTLKLGKWARSCRLHTKLVYTPTEHESSYVVSMTKVLGLAPGTGIVLRVAKRWVYGAVLDYPFWIDQKLDEEQQQERNAEAEAATKELKRKRSERYRARNEYRRRLAYPNRYDRLMADGDPPHGHSL